MANTQQKIKLSEQWDGSRFQFFKKFCSGRSFVLNKDRSQSESIAYALQCIAPAKGEQWDDAAIKAAYQVCTSFEGARTIRRMTPDQIAAIVRQTIAEMGGAPKATATATSSRLYAAITLYLADYKGRVKPSRYQRECIALSAYKAMQSDCDLHTIDADSLRTAVNHFRARPQTTHGAPMAIASVQTTIKAIKSFYDWLDSCDKWIAPRRFEKLFKVRYSSLRTPLEVKHDGCGVDTFTIKELVTLYGKATQRQKLYIGLALNIGETAQGIASLLKLDLLRGEVWTIDRNRGKTGVRGVYPLWPEVQKLVQAEMNNDPSQPLLFLSLDGNPLVNYNKTSRVDSISKTWANLRKACPKVRALGHKYLRKTGASLIEQLTGSESIAELYLSHAGGSIAKKHYLAKDFSHLAEGLEKLRAHLAPMFAADAKGEQATEAA